MRLSFSVKRITERQMEGRPVENPQENPSVGNPTEHGGGSMNAGYFVVVALCLV
jgi:hypothetical protein